MRPDAEIKRDVEAELKRDPAVQSADIAVAVSNGVVLLTGFVRSYRRRRAAEAAAKRVAGVAGVANDIEIRVPLLHRRPDSDIARDVVEALRLDLPDVADAIKVTVRDGWITLEGEVNWNIEREDAGASASLTRGVRGVDNRIRLKPRVMPDDVMREIVHALRRDAILDASRIEVDVIGNAGPSPWDRPLVARTRRGGAGGLGDPRGDDRRQSDRGGVLDSRFFRGPGPVLPGKPLQRVENAVGPRVHGNRREIAPEHDAVSVEHEQGAFADAILLPICAILLRNGALRLEIRQQRNVQVVMLHIRLVAPGAVDRDAQDRRVELVKHRQDLVVQRHLISAHRAPVGRIERQDDRITLEFLKRQFLIGRHPKRESRRHRSRLQDLRHEFAPSSAASGGSRKSRMISDAGRRNSCR